MINFVQSGKSYSITCCKLRRRNGQNIVTGSPNSRATLIADLNVEVPENIFGGQQNRIFEKIIGVGELNVDKVCSHCSALISKYQGHQVVKCHKCNYTLNPNDLDSKMSANIIGLHGGNKIDLIVNERVLSDLFGNLKNLTEDELTLKILQLKSVSICTKGKLVLKMKFNDIGDDVLIAAVESGRVPEDTTVDEKLESETK